MSLSPSLQVTHCFVSPGFGLQSLYYHYHYYSGSSLLSQSGFRPGITLLSLSLSLEIITAQSVRVSAWYQSIIIITIILSHHCSVSPGFGLLSLYNHHHHHSGTSLLCNSFSHLDRNLDSNNNVRCQVRCY